MMAQHKGAGNVLLLVDVSGLIQSSGLLSLLYTKVSTTIEKGELLSPCTKKVVRRGDKYVHNYCLASNPAITLLCIEQEVATVNDCEFELLKAISSKEERLRVYYKAHLKWGAGLKTNDDVYVSLSSKTEPGSSQHVAGVVRYVGEVKHQPGVWFGVEITDLDYRGYGSSSGDQYFTCDHNCAVFLSLDKLQRPPTNNDEPSEDATVSDVNTASDHTHQPQVDSANHPNPEPENRKPQQEDSYPAAYLEVQSRVQIPSSQPEIDYYYGVIRWIGALPKSNELFAGIELDEKVNGCTNGTDTKSKKKFFSCPPGRGIYYPLKDVRPDTRFIDHETHLIMNPLQDVQEEELEDQKISGGEIQRYIGESRGIQGHYNSCYLDATVFGLFALSTEFDGLFSEEFDDPVKNNISHLLWKGIVNPLRKNHIVKFDSVMKLRDELEQVGRLRGIPQKKKDPEEFLNMLFKYTLQVPPFISIRRPYGVEEEYFVQLFLEPDESLVLPSVGDLLKKMFKEQKISFTEVPLRLLIQVPRFGKQFKTFPNIVCELNMDVSSLVDVDYKHKCTVCGEPARQKCNKCVTVPRHGENRNISPYFCDKLECWTKVHQSLPDGDLDHRAELCEEVIKVQMLSELELLSVICIETSHYVCFTRSENQWVFFDSMANRVHDKFNIPKVVDCTHELNEWVYPADGNRCRLMSTQPCDLPEYVRCFTQDIYLCVYIRTVAAVHEDSLMNDVTLSSQEGLHQIQLMDTERKKPQLDTQMLQHQLSKVTKEKELLQQKLSCTITDKESLQQQFSHEILEKKSLQRQLSHEIHEKDTLKQQKELLQHQLSRKNLEKELIQQQLLHEKESLQQQLSQEAQENEALQQMLLQETQEKETLQGHLTRESALSAQLGLRVQELQQELDHVKAEGLNVHYTQLQVPSQDQDSWNVPRDQVEIIEEIGHGGWGLVLKGRFKGQTVAVKQAFKEILQQPYTIRQMKREIQIMASVQHPNIVRFIAAVIDDKVDRGEDTPLLLVELLDMDLRHAYKSTDLGTNTIPIFRDVAYALHYLHDHQEPIIHRDVSAPNVLLECLPGGTYKAKLSDFGSANKVKDSRTAGPGAICYTAPEAFPPADLQAPVAPQTPKIDVFSYGILLAEVITKTMPTTENRAQLVREVQQRWPLMYDLICLCTKSNPSDRPTMASVLNTLNSIPTPCP